MPLDPYEQQMVSFALDHFSTQFGGDWQVLRNLEDEYRSQPVPEVLAGNGAMTAAIEVKQLAETKGRQLGVAESLSRRLTPPCGGGYSLYLGPWNTESIDETFVRHLKREIARVAPTLIDGQSAPIPILRHAIVIYRDYEWKRATCMHDGPFGLLEPLNESIAGDVFLRDETVPGHHFVTADAKSRFLEMIRDTAAKIGAGALRSGVTVSWYEEAELACAYRESGPDDGVTVINSLVPNAVALSDHAYSESKKALLKALPNSLDAGLIITC